MEMVRNPCASIALHTAEHAASKGQGRGTGRLVNFLVWQVGSARALASAAALGCVRVDDQDDPATRTLI